MSGTFSSIARFRPTTSRSDIAGQDIHSHDGDVEKLIEQIATWLRGAARDLNVPGGRAIAGEFRRFRQDLPGVAASKRLETAELTFNDLTAIAAAWIIANNDAV
jgi:hypothetical protein